MKGRQKKKKNLEAGDGAEDRDGVGGADEEFLGVIREGRR